MQLPQPQTKKEASVSYASFIPVLSVGSLV